MASNIPEPNWERCLCHKQGVKEDLKPFTERSWETFKAAADVRQDDVSEVLKDYWIQGPRGFFHRKCYQHYTHAQKLRTIQEKRGAVDVSEQPEKKAAVHSRRSEVSTSSLQHCIICQKQKPVRGAKRSNQRYEKLVELQTCQAATKLREAAQIRCDERILLCIMAVNDPLDLVALEVKYHRSCYITYTHPRYLKKNDDTMDTGCVETHRQSVYDQAFDELCNIIKDKVIDGRDVMSMTDLRDLYVQLLENKEINASTYRTEKLKHRLQTTFNTALGFWKPPYRDKSEIVYSEMVPKGYFAETTLDDQPQDDIDSSNDDSYTDQLPEIKDTEEVLQLYHTAKMIRSEILKVKSVQWPPTTSDLSADKIEVCTHLKMMNAMSVQ